MHHHMGNGGQVAPAVPLRPGQRQNEYLSAPYQNYYGHGVPNGYHHQPHHHPQQYAPQYHRQWNQQQYPPYPMQPMQQYPNPPLVVSSYPHPQPTPPTYQNHQPPPPLPPLQPPTPSAQSRGLLSPASSSTSLNVPTPPPITSSSSLRVNTPPAPPLKRAPFAPPLPWYSVPSETFPPRARRLRRRRKVPPLSAYPVELPSRDAQNEDVQEALPTHNTSTEVTSSEVETPMTSQPPSEADSTHPTTPSSALPPTSATSQSASNSSRTIVPAVPLPSAASHQRNTSVKAAHDAPGAAANSITGPSAAERSTLDVPSDESPALESTTTVTPDSPNQTPQPLSPPRSAPKSWADLVRSHVPKAKQPNGATLMPLDPKQADGPIATPLSDTLHSFEVDSGQDEGRKIAFLEPRGLINTGNMCYMNSVLQVLVFCVPFFGFLDQVGKRVAHSFKSDTPLLDSMIMFMREFRVIDSANSVEQLKMRLKDGELEQYGESFTPDFVYEVIRRLPRFASMRRGHQQDAEEFLGFLLEGLHDECVQVMRGSTSASVSGIASPMSGHGSFDQDAVSDAFKSASPDADSGWLEVGPKQKAAVTRSSGAITTESPITKIFGGKLRSELRVAGLKNSVTLEPYQPLQLDIQSPQIKNITDALRGLTHSEVLHGEFNSPRGPGATATKQVFIESTPPVLILHLKRFQYDNAGGTQKIWKKIGYPLELEIPKEAFPPHRRGGLVTHGGLPKYRLISVVYHHGKNASGGHYTADVRRQEGSEWVRIDDTVIRRVRSEDVAEGGSEEDPKAAAAVAEQHSNDTVDRSNIFAQAGVNGDENESVEAGWKQVNAANVGNSVPGKKTWSKVANGATTPNHGQSKSLDRFSMKDNKVAYILFYQKL
ncbi:MAG: hypothetical protein M4579_002365 [Chaenotheca gracillima]|nr:MAG: hypothetical protein M4579_002365 [Chaenotheca gracillima]